MQKSSPQKSSLPVRIIKGTFFQIFTLFLAIVLLGVGYAAWQSINSTEIAPGQPLTQSLMQKIVANLEDLNSRVTTLTTNLSTLTTKVVAINPSGTTVSSNNICLNGDCKTAWPGSGISQSDLMYYAGTCNASKSGQIKLGIAGMRKVNGSCPAGYTNIGATPTMESGENYAYYCVTLLQYKCQSLTSGLGTYWNWTIQ